MLVQLADRGRKALGTGGAPLQASLEALDAIGYRGPLILECSPQLGGPSLAKQSIDPGRLQSALETSRAFVLRVLGTT
jgi:sugar phosphate isomerase/epimerase